MVRASANSIAAIIGAAIISCGVASAQGVPGGVATTKAVPASGSRVVEKMPIDGLLKVVTESGEVMFLSTDRRFVFRGQMTDLWQGEAVGVDPVGTVLNFERNGVSKEAISFAIGRGESDMTVFIAPECETCAYLVEAMLTDKSLEKTKYRVVLLSSSTEGGRSNRMVWCSNDQSEALKAIYVKGTVPGSLKAPDSTCDQFGLFLAQQAAMVFGIAQLPMVASSDGQAVTGLKAALEKLHLEEE